MTRVGHRRAFRRERAAPGTGWHAVARAGMLAAALLDASASSAPVRAGETDIPIPLCFEPSAPGTAAVRATGGGRFQVIPPGGLDDEQEHFAETTVKPGDIVKLSGVQFQQYVEILAVEPDGVVVKNAGWARFVGEFERQRRLGWGCREPVADPTPPPRLTYAGIGLASDVDQVAATFPNSRRVGTHIYVDPRDVRDHITGIELSAAGAWFFFDRPARPGDPASAARYPPCEQIQARIEARHGMADTVEAFFEERQRRSDRQWLRTEEWLWLKCFAGADGGLLAEAVVIVRGRRNR